MDVLDIHHILQYLPHRPPFLLIDKVVELKSGDSLIAVKNVTMNEPFFKGHFPGRPVMPGVLILEAMAQASGVLAYKSQEIINEGKYIYYLAGIDNARFKRVVEPGDQLRLDVRFTRKKHDVLKAIGTATVDGDVACSAEFMSIGRKIES